jgi:hypothetical protein
VAVSRLECSWGSLAVVAASGSNSFSDLVLSAIQSRVVPRLGVENMGGAVVLERIARGAGGTRWYLLRDPGDVAALVDKLSPGSSVSFYFDGRLALRAYDNTVASEILEIAQADGEAVVARPRTDHVEMEVEFVAGEEELREFVAGLPPGANVVYGRFPAVDDDGVRAVTVDLPDRDGIVRQHPY